MPPPGTTVQALTEADAPARVVAEPHAPNSTPLDHPSPPCRLRHRAKRARRPRPTEAVLVRSRRSRRTSSRPRLQPSSGTAAASATFPRRPRRSAFASQPAKGDDPAHLAAEPNTAHIRQSKFQAGGGRADMVLLLTNCTLEQHISRAARPAWSRPPLAAHPLAARGRRSRATRLLPHPRCGNQPSG